MQAEKHLNVEYDPSTTLGEQWLGLLSVKVKASVKLAPFIYGVGLVVVTIMMLPPLVFILIRGMGAFDSMMELPILLQASLFFAMAPLLVYLFAMLIHLIIDLLKAVLSLGKK